MTPKLPILVLAVAAMTLIGLAVTMPVSMHKGAFFSDEATYYAMAYSLAFDGDIRYQEHDLERVYDRGYTAGPSGMFLRYQAETGRMYFAKAFAYSLVAAPLVRVFGDNGFYLLHALLLSGVLFAGYAYLARTLQPGLATIYVLSYFAGSITLLYYFWITPAIFNLSLGFFATFLWLYKERPPGWPQDASWQPSGWLAGGWTDYAAAILYGVAAYSKPPSVILLAPMLAWMLLQKRFKRAVAVGLLAAAVIVGLFAITHVTTGDWNYMGGDRRSFTGPYPFQYRNQPFHTIGTPMVTDVSEYKNRFPRLDHLAADLTAYVWVGRNAGVLIYMLPAVLAVLAYFVSRHRRWLSPYSLLIAGTAANAFAYMTIIQVNWIGGGGTIGSRYFIGFYYAPFFVIPVGAGLLAPITAFVVWTLFLSQIVLDPWGSSLDPGRHTKAFPFTLLPPEMGMLNDLPFNTNPLARRVVLRESDIFDIYFPDDNTYLQEAARPGFWVKSRGRAEVILRSPQPVTTLVLELTNGPVANRILASIDGQAERVSLGAGSNTIVRLHPTTRFKYGDEYVYRFVVDSRSGGVPMMHSDTNEDYRHLGVFVSPSIEYD
ncbi:MAG: hypothetical protein IH849_04455 [Acidobacteria bacterium]|nr:hypothetical protein [Acidobacteriota bacterium]